MTITWTPEQLAIFDFALNDTRNLCVEALAGAAKSTTLVGLVERVIAAKKHSSALIVAFNKRIAEDMEKRKLPFGVESRTMHSIGMASLKSFLGSSVKIKVDKNKRINLLRAYIESVEDLIVLQALQDNFLDLRDAIAFGAQAGYIPEGTQKHARGMFDSDKSFFAQLTSSHDWSPAPHEQECIRVVSDRAIRLALEGSIDFDDMILIPALFPASFRPFDLTLVDEAQDLSTLQHRMLSKMVGRKRIIAVGDSCQAIYGFRGAHEDSLELLRTKFSMTTLNLSTSFRCPRTVAEHVRWRAPFITSPAWAIDGEVVTMKDWDADSIPDGAAIICRNNAPLFGIALRLLRSGRRPSLMGNDIVRVLVKDMKALSKDITIDREESLRRLYIWGEKQLKKYNNSSRIQDKIDCIRMFIIDQPTLGFAIAQAERIENMTGTITLCTGHKSKGLEFDEVFFLDEALINPKRGGQQENNLRYVICTRAKKRLVYVESDKWAGPGLELDVPEKDDLSLTSAQE